MDQIERAQLARVIAVINGKGGVLKTTVSTNTAGMLAASGFRVLVVDLDPQGNAGDDLGYSDTDVDDQGRGLAASLSFGAPVQVRREVRPGLDVLPGGPHLSAAAAALSSPQAADGDPRLALARVLAPIAHEYDLVIIDCPPGEQMLQTNAIAAARYALVPMKSDKSSRGGVVAVAARLAAVMDVNPDLDLLGVVLCDVGAMSRKVRRNAEARVAEVFGGDAGVVFESVVRHSESTAQTARDQGKLVFELEEAAEAGPKWWEVRRGDADASTVIPASVSKVAQDLHNVAQEMVSRLTAAENADQQQAAGVSA